MNEKLVKEIMDIVEEFYCPKPMTVYASTDTREALSKIKVPKLTKEEARDMLNAMENIVVIGGKRIEQILNRWQDRGFFEKSKTALNL